MRRREPVRHRPAEDEERDTNTPECEERGRVTESANLTSRKPRPRDIAANQKGES